MSPNGTNTFCGSQLLTVPLGSSNGYQWKKDGAIISGANGNTYNATSSGSYTCVITNGSCSFTTVSSILNTTSSPVGSINQTFSIGQTLANLAITGTNLLWYNAATSGNILSNSTPLISGTTYYVSQTVNGCEGPRLAVTVSLALDINENQLFTITYNPNPVTNFLDVKSNEILKSVSIMNALGQIIKKKNFNNTDLQLDLANLSAGCYFVKVQSDEKQNTFKILKK